MWAVAKIKINEVSSFKSQIISKIGKDTSFYIPKVKVQTFKKNKLKNKEKFVLENYIFCFNKKFEDKKTFTYNSKTNSDWMSSEQLQEWLDKNKEKMGIL